MTIAKQVFVTGLALAANGLLSCGIPKPECSVGQTTYLGGQSGNDYAAFAVRYVPKDGNPNGCPVMTGEVVGMHTYHPESTEQPGIRDFSKTTIALRTHSMGELYFMVEDLVSPEAARAEGQKPNALGAFTAQEPDDADFCHLEEISEARLAFAGATVPLGVACTTNEECEAAAPGATCETFGTPARQECAAAYPATELAYRWSNVQVYVTAAAPGSQFEADVEIEIDGCTAAYRAVGMWPAVDCGVRDPETGEVTGTDDRLCNPEPNEEEGRILGSGINPDFGPTRCDASIEVLPLVDRYHAETRGRRVSAPRCALATDQIPALEGFSPPAAD